MLNIIISIILIVLVVWFFVANTKRKKANAINDDKSDNKPDYRQLLKQHIDYYNKLNNQDKLRFEGMVIQFLDAVSIEGVGLAIDETDKIMVAASAIIPVFGFPDWHYHHLTSVLVYPDTFNHDFEFEGGNSRSILGMVGSGYMNGQMILSKAALLKGFSENNGAENAAVHEFVHLIDGEDGAIDGVPAKIEHSYATPWLQMMHKEMSKIKKGKSDINAYAATSEAEFLAVAGEYFFSKSDRFEKDHPQLFEMLSRFFNQNPKTD